VTKFGAFPSQRRPKVIWLGLQGIPQKPLYDLQKKIESVLQELGFEAEKRRFAPHLTLGRIKFPMDISPFWNYFDEKPFPEYRFRVSEYVLMQSDLKPSGAVYTPIQKYSLRTL
jgi:2'-5' RNA ligase